MNVHNLSMIFAPNFLRCPSDNLAIIFENTKYEQTFMRTLLLHLNSEDFFSDGRGIGNSNKNHGNDILKEEIYRNNNWNNGNVIEKYNISGNGSGNNNDENEGRQQLS